MRPDVAFKGPGWLPSHAFYRTLSVLLLLFALLSTCTLSRPHHGPTSLDDFINALVAAPPHDLHQQDLTMPSAVQQMFAHKEGKANLILVSNRLPITVKKGEDGQYEFSMSSGGLVTGIMGVAKDVNFVWYGWPGLEVPEAERAPMIKTLKRDFSAEPVFLSKEDMDRHYNGFSSTLPS